MRYLLASLLMLAWTAGVVSVYVPTVVAEVAEVATSKEEKDGSSYGANNNNSDNSTLRNSIGHSGESDEESITAACFKVSVDVPLFCLDASLQWGAEALAVGNCETDFNPEAVGLLGEKGILQIHPIHKSDMESKGLDFENEADRMYYGLLMYNWQDGWIGPAWVHCGPMSIGAVVAESGEY